MRQVILDTETTGLQTEEGHRIIEIGCIELIDRKITGKRYHQYINPERIIDDGALAVHGITNQFLINKPVFSAIVDEFMSFIQGAELIIHNAAFDVGFINYELKLTGKKFPHINDETFRIIDTLMMARQMHAGQRNSLDALCKRYSVDNSQRDLHGALLDAHLLAQVYLAMTGGQGSLFEEIDQHKPVLSDTIEKIVVQSRAENLRILYANSLELDQHKEHLSKMHQKGKCLWWEE